MSNVEDKPPVGGYLNRSSLKLIVADTAQDAFPDGNQLRPIPMDELFKQIRELAGIKPFPQQDDTWDVGAHPKIFILLTADQNLTTVNDSEPGLECEVEVIQDATGNHKLTINTIDMGVPAKGSSLVTGRRYQDGLKFNAPGALAGAKPEIIEHPQGMTATIGTTAAFKSKARNYDSVILLRNGIPVKDSQGTAYQLTIGYDTKGAYQYKYINKYGFDLTDPANIDTTESDVPAIISEPTDQTINEGETFIIPFIVSGPALVFRVFKNDIVIATSNNATFTKPNAKVSDTGIYRVEANNSLGQVISVSVNVVVNAIILPIPVITFTQPSGMTVGAADQLLQATSNNSVTPIVFTSSDPSVAIITGGNKLRVMGPGNVDIIASQAAGNGYQAAASVTKSVVMAAQPIPTITFAQPTDMTVGDGDQTLSASSTNTVTPVVLTSSNVNVATIVNGKLRIIGPGTAVITASQVAGNGYQAAQAVTWTVTIKAQQAAVITFLQPSNMTVGDPDQTLNASSTNSVTPVVFSTSDTSKATIVNGKLHIVAAGTFTVYADQAAGNGFLAASRVSRSVSIFSAVAPTKVLVRISGDSFVRNIGGTGVGSSSSGTGPGIMSITNQIKARLAQQSGTNVQFTVTDDGGHPGQTASWFATNGQNVLANNKSYITANAAAYDRVIFIPIYGTNDEGVGGVNDTTSVDKIISDLNNCNTQLKALSNKVQIVGYPITMRKDGNMQPGTSNFRTAYNSRIAANPAVINANVVGNFSLYPEIYSDNAPDDATYFKVNDADTLSKVHPTDLGYYRISEMLSQQIAALCSVSLTADGDPIIYQHPASQNLAAGQSFSLSVLAMGLNLTYQWKKGTANISNATSSVYTKNSAVGSDTANYAVVVANSVRSITSNAAAVAVEAPPSVSLLSTLPTGLSYLAAITADGSGVNEVSTQGNFTSFSGRGMPSKVANAINGKAAYKFTGTNPDGFKLSLTNVQRTIMVAVTVRIDSRDNGKESVILSLPFNQAGFNLCNNYPDRTISGVQGLEVGGVGVNAGLATGDLATFVFFTDADVAKVRFKGVTYTASGSGSFTTLESALNDFLVGGKTDADYPSPFDGIMGGFVIANGNVTEAKAIQVEAAMNSYYGL